MLGVNKSKKIAFTLTELLIAMGIIGLIAAITIPSLVNNIYKRAFATELKNITGSIKQLAQEQMIKHKVYYLEETDFKSAAELFKDENFAISQKCGNPLVDCWKTSATGKDKITYQFLNGTNVADTAKNNPTIVLKNGAILMYRSGISYELDNGDKIIGNFFIDVNGNEPPNIEGRDFFSVYITNKGKITNAQGNDKMTTEEYKSGCLGESGGAASYCYSLIEQSGWTMPY